MAGSTDKSAAMAEVYAESLLLAAHEQGQEEQIAAELDDLIAYMNHDAEFDTFLTSDSVDDDSRRSSLEKLFRGKMNDLLLNLLQVLNNRGRCSLIRTIRRCIELRMQQRQQQREVVVETALPLSNDLRAGIKKEVSEWIGKEALLQEAVRPELIGGMVIRIGDMQIDGSVASQLDLMHKRLVGRAVEEIRSDREYVTE